jgi:hypothetical protein
MLVRIWRALLPTGGARGWFIQSFRHCRRVSDRAGIFGVAQSQPPVSTSVTRTAAHIRKQHQAPGHGRLYSDKQKHICNRKLQRLDAFGQGAESTWTFPYDVTPDTDFPAILRTKKRMKFMGAELCIVSTQVPLRPSRLQVTTIEH